MIKIDQILVIFGQNDQDTTKTTRSPTFAPSPRASFSSPAGNQKSPSRAIFCGRKGGLHSRPAIKFTPKFPQTGKMSQNDQI